MTSSPSFSSGIVECEITRARVKIATREEGDKRSCILLAQISQRKIRGHSYSIPNSTLGIESAFFAMESSLDRFSNYFLVDDGFAFLLVDYM